MGLHRVNSGVTSEMIYRLWLSPKTIKSYCTVQFIPTGAVVPSVSDENSFYSFVFPTQTVFRRLSRIIDLFWTQIGSHFDANQKEQ